MNTLIKMQFDPKIAKDVGTDSAIIYANIEFWCAKNKANNRNKHDGDYWTYNSIKAFKEQFNYLSEKQIRRCLKKLEDKGYIKVGCFNKVGFDKTKWYSAKSVLPNGQFDLPKRANGDDQMGKPIPYNKPYIKPDNVSPSETSYKDEYIINLDRDETLKKIDDKNEKLHFRIAKSLNTFFVEYCQKNGIKVRNHITKAKASKEMWSIKKLLEDYDEADVRKVIKWLYDGKNGADFWQEQVRSALGFREKFEKMKLRMINNKQKEKRL